MTHIPVPFPIDAVYLWVNSSDPEWSSNLERYKKMDRSRYGYTPHSLGNFRYADHGELKFSLRSLARYAPFIRNVFIVMDGGLPPWLDTSSPNLRVLSTNEIVPDRIKQPLFYSDVFELYLHRIEGLAEHYLYLNDDMFFAASTTADDFFDAGGVAQVRMEPYLIPLAPGTSDDTYSRIWKNTFSALRKQGGAFHPVLTSKKRIPLWLRCALRRQLPWNPPAHVLQPFRRSVWREFHQEFKDEITRMEAHRFRSRNGIATNVAAHYLSRHLGRSKFIYPHDWAAIFRESSLESAIHTRKVIMDAPSHGIKLFCLNDGADLSGMDWGKFVQEIGETLFPSPSPWEKKTA